MMEVGLKLGFSPRLRERQRPDRVGLSFEITFARQQPAIHKKNIAHIPYQGMVYDLGIPNRHRFLVRQNGFVWLSGNSWVQDRWRIETEHAIAPFVIWKAPVSEGGMTRQFIPAKVTDNATLFKGDPGYLNRLRALPWEEYQAKALGNWSVFTGQFFMRWRSEIHVLAPFDIPPDWERFICVDYGFYAPYAVIWFARPPGSDLAFVYREHYGIGVGLDEQIRKTHGSVANSSERIRAIILDPSMYNKVNVKGERIDSMAWDWCSVFGGETKVIAGDKNRVAGWCLMREMIDWTEGPSGDVLRAPRLRVFSNCSNTIRTLPRLVQDENNPEDIDSDGEDHIADALRYGLVHAFRGGSATYRSGRKLTLNQRGLVFSQRMR